MAELRVIFWNMKIKLRVFLTHLTLRIDQQEIFYTKYQLGYFIIIIIQHFQGYLKANKGSEGNCYFYHVSKQINLDSETLSVRPPLLLAL